MSEDWFAWHGNYDRNRNLQARLSIVCDQLSACLSHCEAGPVRVISVCAGDGRDLLMTMIDQPRAPDVQALLVEQDARLVKSGQSAADLGGIGERLRFIEGDATDSSVYQGFAPADVVLVCGVFGHVREQDVPQLIQSLTLLCKSGGSVVWTRSTKAWDGENNVNRIKELFQAAEFVEVAYELTPRGASGIGTHRYLGSGGTLPESETLFIFTGSDFSNTDLATS